MVAFVSPPRRIAPQVFFFELRIISSRAFVSGPGTPIIKPSSVSLQAILPAVFDCFVNYRCYRLSLPSMLLADPKSIPDTGSVLNRVSEAPDPLWSCLIASSAASF